MKESSELWLQLARCLAWRLSVNDLQRELDYPGSPCAGDNSPGRWSGTLSTGRAARQVKICVIEDVVELGTELYLQPLHRSTETLVDGEICLVERRSASGIARQSAERRQQRAAGIGDGRQL